jgi:hypothetical protein
MLEIPGIRPAAGELAKKDTGLSDPRPARASGCKPIAAVMGDIILDPEIAPSDDVRLPRPIPVLLNIPAAANPSTGVIIPPHAMLIPRLLPIQ